MISENGISQSKIEELLVNEFIDQLHRPLTAEELKFINWMADYIELEKN